MREQVDDLDQAPLIVVGSGVTGAELRPATWPGIPVTLVSSRDRVLPGEDADAAGVLEEVVSARRGMTVLSRSRMESVTRAGDAVAVTLTDGRVVEGSHCILALGSVPNTADLGLDEAGVEVTGGGFVNVDRRSSRTSARGSSPGR